VLIFLKNGVIAKIVEIKPGFVEGLPVTLPGSFLGPFQRGFNFVRQLSQPADPEIADLAHEMVEGFLDDYDEDEIITDENSDSSFEYEFGAIGTPKHKRRLRKRQISTSEINAEIAPLLVNEEIAENGQNSVEPVGPNPEQNPETQKMKPKNRRKRTKKTGKNDKNQKKIIEKKVS